MFIKLFRFAKPAILLSVFLTSRLFPYIAHTNCIKMVESKTTPSIFSKDNYIWMAIGAAIITIGMFLMSGGASTDPAVFNKDEVYSITRITIAPILILLGLVIEIYAIFKKPKG